MVVKKNLGEFRNSAENLGLAFVSWYEVSDGWRAFQGQQADPLLALWFNGAKRLTIVGRVEYILG